LSAPIAGAAETLVLQTASTAFVISATVILVALTVCYAASAVKGHVNTASTVEALFTGVDKACFKEFTIKRPIADPENNSTKRKPIRLL